MVNKIPSRGHIMSVKLKTVVDCKVENVYWKLLNVQFNPKDVEPFRLKNTN